MLEYSEMEIAQVSDSLGYAAPGAFTRAFRRWTGTTPVEWRATPASARLYPSKGVFRGKSDTES